MAKIGLIAGTLILFVSVFTNTPFFSSSEKTLASSFSSKPGTPGRSMELGQFIRNKLVPKKNQSVILNDPAIYKKWGLQKSNALDAWQLTTGSRDIVVAVIDTGIDIHHKDIQNNLWKNPGETGKDSKGRDKATNGVDDDKNGFVDDVHGWNFVHNNSSLTDNHGHGTHIAGIVGAEGGNSYGVTGVAPKVSLMVIKYYDPKTPGNNLLNTIRAIDYAVKMNAHIINYSGGGLEFSSPEYAAVARAQQKGILFVAAAGNERSNSDYNKYYPADYELDNIISVTAINPSIKVLNSSNFGVHTVDIAAPGENIYSTLPGGAFGPMTGTSQATAFVSGVAALLMAHNRDFDAPAVKKYILRTGDTYAWLRSKTGTSKKLNIYRALTMLDQGVGATGVVATNTATIDSDTFSTANSARTNGTNIKSFGQQLLRAVNSEEK